MHTAPDRTLNASQEAGPWGRLRELVGSSWPYRIVRWALAGMFLVAGVLKLADPAVFAATIDAFGLVPKGTAPLAALVLPVVEIGAGLALVWDWRGSLGIIVALNVFFIGILSYGLYLGLDIDCGCYGPGDPEGEAFHSLRTSLYRDLVFMAAAFYLYWWRWVNRPSLVRPLVRLKNRRN